MKNLELTTFEELFSGEAIFRIPNYQRGFAWQKTHLLDFWNDLVGINSDRTHYTGMVTLVKNSDKSKITAPEDCSFLEDKSKSSYHIVDGQQRITTAIVLINSILGYAEEQGYEKLECSSLESIRSKYIACDASGLEVPLFGYESDNPSYRYLRYRIFKNDCKEETQESYYTNNLQNAKDLFDALLKEYCRDKTDLETLFAKLTKRMQFILHIINENLNVFVAFETMNNRGKKLSNLELLKNRLIYLVTLFDDAAVNKYRKEKLTQIINEKWSEVYKWLGKNKERPLDDDEFLRNHWILYFGYKRTSEQDYVSFLLKKQFTARSIKSNYVSTDVSEVSSVESEADAREIIDPDTEGSAVTPDSIEKYVTDLAFVARLWYYSYYPEDKGSDFTEDETISINRLNRIGIAYFRPLLVASFANGDITSAQRLRLFTSIERTILLLFRMARYMSTYQNSVYYRFAHEMKESNNIVQTTYHLDKLFLDNLIPGVRAFKDKMSGEMRNGEGFYQWNSLRFVLYEYEVDLCGNRHDLRVNWKEINTSVKDRVTVEHIYPQTPTKEYWPDYTEEGSALVNSLGNLLLLKQSKNSSLQNYPFDLKKVGNGDFLGYCDGSDSEREVCKEEKWTPVEIAKRGMKLLDFITRRWRITFRDRSQMYDILGIPEKYRLLEHDTPLDNDLDELKEELLGNGPQPAYGSSIDYPINEILQQTSGRARLFIDRIICGDTEYTGEGIYDMVVQAIQPIIASDPQKMHQYCGIREKRKWFPKYSLEKPNSNRFVEFSGVYVSLTGGKDSLATLLEISQIYGLNPSEILVRIRKR